MTNEEVCCILFLVKEKKGDNINEMGNRIRHTRLGILL